MEQTITLKNLPEKTAQEVFDYVAEHLLTQNKAARDGRNGCLYLTKDGLRCAAGCLIAPEEYLPEWENETWGELISRLVVPPRHGALICDLQCIHDATPDVSKWPERLELLAKKRKLNTDVLARFNR